MVWAHKRVLAGRMACEMAHRMACEIAHGMVGHKLVCVACILKNNPVLAHMMLDNRLGLVVADILHSGNPVVDRMVDSIQGAAADSYIAGVGNTQGAAADSYIAGVGNTQGAVGNSYIAGVDTQAGNLMVQHMGNAAQRLKQHTNLKI